MDSLEYGTCEKVDAESEVDGLDGLRHLTFEETKGERDIWESHSKEGAHMLPMKLRKTNVGMEDKPKITSMGDYSDE